MEATPRGPFPNELWVDILEHLRFKVDDFHRPLADHEARAALVGLASAARVNKNFNDIATRPLYHTLPISPNLISRSKLASTLTSRPDLAQMVQEARITDDMWAHDELVRTVVASRDALPPVSQDSRHFFQHILTRLKRRRIKEEHMVFFLGLLPNLRVVDLEVDAEFTRCVEMMWILDGGWRGIMSRAEVLRLRHLGTPLTGCFSGANYRVHLPRIRNFHDATVRKIHETRALRRGGKGPGLPEVPKVGLRHMVLRGNFPRHKDFHDHLSQCAQLETLRIDMPSDLHSTKFSKVGGHLRYLGRNLEELHLCPTSHLERYTGPLGPLELLNQLKRLSLPWDIMVKDFARDVNHVPVSAGGDPHVPNLIDQLPNSLEHLGLYLDSSRLENWQLIEVLQSERLPRLKSVHVTHRWNLDEIGRPQVAFRQVLDKLGWNARRYTEKGYDALSQPFQHEWMVLERRGACSPETTEAL